MHGHSDFVMFLVGHAPEIGIVLCLGFIVLITGVWKR